MNKNNPRNGHISSYLPTQQCTETPPKPFACTPKQKKKHANMFWIRRQGRKKQSKPNTTRYPFCNSCATHHRPTNYGATQARAAAVIGPHADTNISDSSLPTPQGSPSHRGFFRSKARPPPPLHQPETFASHSTCRNTSSSSTGCRRVRFFPFVSPAGFFRRVMEYVVAGRPQACTVAPVGSDHPPRKRSGVMRQRRLDLELEVAELKKQLSNEQTVHDILERALQPNSTRSSILYNIPAFIPKRTKELLAELVLVEEEIARLENQIDKMKGGLSAMQEERAKANTHSHSQSQDSNATAAANGNGSTRPPSRQPPDSQPPSPQGKVVPEIKSMFFISQAMNGEYLQRHLGDDKLQTPKDMTLRRGVMSPKHSVFNLPPRHSLEKQSERNVEKTSKIFQDPPIIKSSTNKDDQKIQPNKLSERIVKCLICIFIRLIRTSRAAELEKSGNLARSANPGSFRMDTVMNITTSTAKEKERGQQDHYGIFSIQDSIVRDIGPYKNLVRFTSSSFDLRGFSSSPLLSKLRGMLEALQQVDLRFLTHQQKLAFWLNIYNTCIMHGILQHGLPSNPEKLLAVKNKATVNVGGQKFNALVIENFILRQPSSVKEELWKCEVDVEEQEVRNLYGLDNAEPNILFALCCGIRSSPALRIYKPDRVMMDLEKAKLDYLQASLVVTSARRLMIPYLIHSNMHDFAKDLESLVRWICEQLPTSWSLRRSMVDCLRGQSNPKIDEVVEVIPYDYEFQYLLPM